MQLEIYRYLMGAVGRKVKTNDLWLLQKATSCVNDPMKIKTTDGVLHAKYKHYKDKIYDSSKDPVYLENPYRLI
jgi:hypothetical protein